jgi:hypothetical protein
MIALLSPAWQLSVGLAKSGSYEYDVLARRMEHPTPVDDRIKGQNAY